MDILRMFYRKNSLKRKILDIKKDIKIIVAPLCNENFFINWYGAYYIDPKYLVFRICVKSDKMKFTFKSNNSLMNELKNLLIKHDYPQQARQFVHIDFESQETVDRESNGSWYNHFK